MAVTYGSVAALDSTTASTVTIGKPTGTASGDILVAVVFFDSFVNATVTAAPSGWTAVTDVYDNGSANDCRSYLYWKLAGGSEPANYSWTLSASRYHAGAIVRVTGADTTTPIDVSASRSAFAGADETSTSAGLPAVTTTEASTLGVGLINAWSSTPGNNTLTGWTNRANYDGTYGGVWTRDLATATTYAAVTTGETEADSYVGFTVAIKAAAAGGVSGTGAPSLARHTGSGSGSTTSPTTTGTAAVTLVRHAGSGSGFTTAPPTTGSGSPTLARHAGAGSGSTTVPSTTGSGSLTCTRHAAAGVGSTGLTGAAGVALVRHALAGSGTSTPPSGTGAGSPTLARHAGAGAGATVAPAVTGAGTLLLARHAALGVSSGVSITGRLTTTDASVARTSSDASVARTTTEVFG